jgi:HSP20 family protein
MSDRTDPFAEIERLVERLTDAGGGGIEDALAPSPRTPVDVLDHDDEFEVRVDLPGVDREAVDVLLSGRTLEVRAERSFESTEEDATHVRQERRWESVDRSVDLPESVDEAAVEATLSDGVLTVRLPKQRPEDETLDIDIE